MHGITAHSSWFHPAHTGQYLTHRNLTRQVCRTEAGLTRFTGLGQGILQPPTTLGKQLFTHKREGSIAICLVFHSLMYRWQETSLKQMGMLSLGLSWPAPDPDNSTAVTVRKGGLRMQKSAEVGRPWQKETCFYLKPCAQPRFFSSIAS